MALLADRKPHAPEGLPARFVSIVLLLAGLFIMVGLYAPAAKADSRLAEASGLSLRLHTIRAESMPVAIARSRDSLVPRKLRLSDGTHDAIAPAQLALLARSEPGPAVRSPAEWHRDHGFAPDDVSARGPPASAA